MSTRPQRPRRSAMYVPAINARAVEKSRTLDMDSVIYDLEDAVAPDMKATARAQLVAAFDAGGFGHRETVIRINAADTAVADYLNVTTVAEPVPAPVKSAALLLVGTLYEQRESQGDRQFYKNPTFENLLNPYRVMVA